MVEYMRVWFQELWGIYVPVEEKKLGFTHILMT